MSDKNNKQEEEALISLEEYLRTLSIDDVTRKWVIKNNTKEESLSRKDWSKKIKIS